VDIMETKITNKILTCVFVFLALVLFGATIVTAAPGDLDPTFGSGGIVIAEFGRDIAIQADGKIVVVATSADPETNNAEFAVARYNPNGSLDTSFGGTGMVLTPVGFFLDQAQAVAIQSDGKIVVVGLSESNSGNGWDMSLVRYNPNGSLDTSFNGTGKVITPVGTSSSAAESVTIQTDGKIVVAGISRNGMNREDFTVVRYNPNGSLDTTFNGTGKVMTPVSLFDFARSVAIQTDGRIVVAGHVSDGTTLFFGVVRYNSNGSLDTSFGGTGKVMTLVGNSGGEGKEVAIQADGKIVVVGNSLGRDGDSTTSDFGIVRYNTDGSLDTSFGGTGKIIIPVGNYYDYATSAAIQADGKIVAAGRGSYNGTNPNIAVVRLNPNGALDTTFGGTGKVTTQIAGNEVAQAVAIQPDGKIVTVGYTNSGIDSALVRYQGGSNANIRTRFDFDGDGRADVSVFRPSEGNWYLNRSTQGFSATQFGLSTDKITPADYDGDGRADIAVFRDGTWYLLRSTAGFAAIQFGQAGDTPVPADFTGDGRAELAVYRNGFWYTLDLQNNQFRAVQFGVPTDKPVMGDYDGDGLSDNAVYRDGVWYLLRSTQGFAAIQFGFATDKPVPADFDGDGKTDLAVYRNGTWYLLQSVQGFAAFQFGIASDTPAPADYDGDGRTDAAVFRDGNWYLRQTTNGFAAQQFGIINDKPIPAAFLP
jgi:uncharacterized delta-60 repeat protein